MALNNLTIVAAYTHLYQKFNNYLFINTMRLRSAIACIFHTRICIITLCKIYYLCAHSEQLLISGWLRY